MQIICDKCCGDYNKTKNEDRNLTITIKSYRYEIFSSKK